jgi:hypothetical protein
MTSTIYITFCYQELYFDNTSSPVFNKINDIYTKIGTITLNNGNATISINNYTINYFINNIEYNISVSINEQYVYKDIKSLQSDKLYTIYPSWCIDNNSSSPFPIYNVTFSVTYDSSNSWFTQAITIQYYNTYN